MGPRRFPADGHQPLAVLEAGDGEREHQAHTCQEVRRCAVALVDPVVVAALCVEPGTQPQQVRVEERRDDAGVQRLVRGQQALGGVEGATREGSLDRLDERQLVGVSAAAPAAWRTRNPTSTHSVLLAAAPTLAAVNTTLDARRASADVERSRVPLVGLTAAPRERVVDHWSRHHGRARFSGRGAWPYKRLVRAMCIPLFA
jgi:hypothetical protein